MAASPFFLPPGLPANPALLSTLLDLLPMGVIYYTPVVDAAGTLADLALAYLNPTAQRMTQLPAQPGTTYRQQFPTTDENGAWDFHRRSWLGPEPGHFQFYYDVDGFDSYFRVTAQRLGEGLLVVFTDTRDEVRSQVEVALRESQAREQAARAEAEAQQAELRAVFEQAPVAIALLQGPAHVVEFANTRMAQLWGRPLAQVVGQPHFTALPDLAGQGFEAVFDAVLRTGEPRYFQEQAVTINRAEQRHSRYFNITYQPSYNGQGQRTGLIASALEVTDQVLARQQVEQLNQELETRVQARTRETLALQAELLAAAQRQVQVRESFYQVFEQTPAAVSLLRGPSYRFEYVNPVYQQVFAGRQLVGHDFAEALPDAAAQGYLALLDGVYQTGETFFGAEVPFVSEQPDAPTHTVYFTFTYQAYRENGEITGISTFALDVTEQVLARQERETQQRELEQLFQQAPTPIVILEGPDLVFRLVNPACQRIFPGRELLHRPLLVALPELADTPIPGLFHQVYQTGEPVVVQEMPLMMARYEGQALEEIYCTFSYLARRDAHGVIDGVRVFAYDITEQVRTRQAVAASAQQAQALAADLAAANQQLTRTNVDLDTFVYTASHDLKAPITNIESIVLALRETLPAAVQQDELVAHLLDLLNQTVARFQFTIGQLTDLSKLQLAHTGPAEPVHLATVVADVRLDLAPLIEAAAAQLTVEIAPDLVVSFSPFNLRSIVYNLLSNALKYRAFDRPTQVRVHAAPADTTVVLTVQDNGLGMSELQQRQLFGLFQRLHTHVEGTGVGLYTTKRLIENAGGSIAVASQVDGGTTFTVSFPA